MNVRYGRFGWDAHKAADNERKHGIAFARVAELGIAPPRGRPRKSNAKVSLTLRLDPDIVDHFRATGRGWQTRINDALRQAVDAAPTGVTPAATSAASRPAPDQTAGGPNRAKPRKAARQFT